MLSIKGKELEVQLGGLKTTVKVKDCKFVEKAQKQQPAQNNGKGHKGRGGNSFISKTQEAHRDIDIRGMMVNEAEVLLGKFIDDSLMAGLSQVLIIHGKGTGALRTAVQAELKRQRIVKSFRLGVYGEGESGVTIAELNV